MLDVVAETQDTSLQRLMGIDGIGILALSRSSPSRILMKAGSLIALGQLTGVFEEFYLIAASRKIENPISSQIMKSFHL